MTHAAGCGVPDCTIPDGVCHCGCGAPTAVAVANEPKRQRVAGSPYLFVRGHNPRPRRDPQYVIDANGCWLWTGHCDDDGYGQWTERTLEGRKTFMAHRRMYEVIVGQIPDGLELDHTCRVRPCVNPLHLEPVTFAENQRRMRALASSLPRRE